jgi:hypothetical protein
MDSEMARWASLLVLAACAFAADDAWEKVKALKSGTEVRIVKKGSAQAVTAKFDELSEESLIVVVKNEQIAIPRVDVVRLDARPQGGSRMNVETKKTINDPDPRPPAGMAHGAAVPGSSTSSNVTLGSKPDFETIYRAPAAAPKKTEPEKK